MYTGISGIFGGGLWKIPRCNREFTTSVCTPPKRHMRIFFFFSHRFDSGISVSRVIFLFYKLKYISCLLDPQYTFSKPPLHPGYGDTSNGHLSVCDYRKSVLQCARPQKTHAYHFFPHRFDSGISVSRVIFFFYKVKYISWLLDPQYTFSKTPLHPGYGDTLKTTSVSFFTQVRFWYLRIRVNILFL